MNNKYLIVIILALLSTSCNSRHRSQQTQDKNISTAVISKGSLINITPQRLINLAETDPNFLLINVSETNGTDSILKSKFQSKYAYIPSSVIFLKPDTLPMNKTLVLFSLTGKTSLKVAYFLVEKGMTVYNLQGGLKNYQTWLKEKTQKKTIKYHPDTMIEKSDYGC